LAAFFLAAGFLAAFFLAAMMVYLLHLYSDPMNDFLWRVQMLSYERVCELASGRRLCDGNHEQHRLSDV
jgi:hypothetical protein